MTAPSVKHKSNRISPLELQRFFLSISSKIKQRYQQYYLKFNDIPPSYIYITFKMPDLVNKIEGAVGGKLNQKSQPGDGVERTADTDVNSSTV